MHDGMAHGLVCESMMVHVIYKTLWRKTFG